MNPYFQDELITLYHGDCRDILPELGHFDLLLTDPPYGLRDKLRGGTWGKAFKGEGKDWDAAIVDLRPALEHSDRAVVWGGNYYPLQPSRGWLVWSKIERGLSFSDAELAWTSEDMPVRVFDGGQRTIKGRHRVHPTQKPIGLMKFCISALGSATSILDPYAGSGTTGVAAKECGIPCTLIELHEEYCEAAAKRLQQEILQLGA